MGLLDRFRKPRREAPSAGSSAPEAPRSREGVLAELRTFVASQSGLPITPEQVSPEASLLEEGILDSVAGVQLLVHVEETWGLEIEEAELVGRLHCLARLADAILEHLGEMA